MTKNRSHFIYTDTQTDRPLRRNIIGIMMKYMREMWSVVKMTTEGGVSVSI